ncbi:E3 SUMO-protein ligase KIAA1586-like, partial [Contarinia nasturtii]|uniref:E3 SUMO-protein ligase KIAA1586-like n=1 Tax=Contarinia nasturtii TaxID=265458 RepID=UPI0012D4137E
MGFPKNRKPAVAFENGVLFDTKKKNQETLSEHAKSKAHANVISKLQQDAAKKQRTSFLQGEEAEETKDNNYLEVTARIIRTVFVINKLSLPFSDHAALISLQQLNGLSMGWHHFDRTACTKITADISAYMHDTLINSLIQNEMPISIIIDDSTDAGNVHFKIVYFQTIESDRPVIYFYKLIELSAGTGIGGFQAITSAWESEKRTDFISYMNKNLIGFSSDGDSTNTGKHTGILKYLKDWSSKPIFSVHCMSHRLELVIKHAFEKLIDEETNHRIVSEYLDKTINQIHKFYNAQGYKRLTHLKQTCKANKEKFYSLSKIIEIRWIASDYRAMKSLNFMWDMIVKDLEDGRYLKAFLKEARCENADTNDIDRCFTVSKYLQSDKITYKNFVLNDDKDEIPE